MWHWRRNYPVRWESPSTARPASYDERMLARDLDKRSALIDVRLLNRPAASIPFEQFPEAGGAECVFLGRTRRENHAKHGKLVRLSYEAYEPMAEKVLRELTHKAAEQFECLAIRVHHSLGDVAVGDASVLVQVACGHRAAAFDACRFLIDRLKAEAPIWKREIWADGTTWSRGQPVEMGTAP